MAKREYIQANKDWLEAKAQEDGVKALPKGIYYKVLAEGNAQSAKPSVRSIVTAHYTGKTINGKTFDSSRQFMFSSFNSILSLLRSDKRLFLMCFLLKKRVNFAKKVVMIQPYQEHFVSLCR